MMVRAPPTGCLAHYRWTIHLHSPNSSLKLISIISMFNALAYTHTTLNHIRGAERNRKWVKWNGLHLISPRISMTFSAHTHKDTHRVPLNTHNVFISGDAEVKTQETCLVASFYYVQEKEWIDFYIDLPVVAAANSQSLKTGAFSPLHRNQKGVVYKWTKLVQFWKYPKIKPLYCTWKDFCGVENRISS